MTQPGGDHTSIVSGGTGYALYSQPNTAAGTNDIDGGECIATSPTFFVAADSILSAWYFHGQRTAGDDSNDFFRLELSLDAGASWTSMVEIGDVSNDAWWREATAAIPANSQVQLRISASDGTAVGDLVEAGIDDITICSSGTEGPTGSPTGSVSFMKALFSPFFDNQSDTLMSTSQTNISYSQPSQQLRQPAAQRKHLCLPLYPRQTL